MPTQAKQLLNVNLIGGVSITRTETVRCVLNTACVDQTFFVCPVGESVVVTGISEVHSTAGTDAGAVNLQVTKDSGTAAPGAGTDLLTNNTNAGFDLKATANTVQNGALVTTEATRTLVGGDRLSLDFAGTVTNLAGVVVTVSLRKVL